MRVDGGGGAATDFRAQLTVVIMTSSAPSNPITELIEQVLASLVAHAMELAACAILIVCDGCHLAARSA